MLQDPSPVRGPRGLLPIKLRPLWLLLILAAPNFTICMVIVKRELHAAVTLRLLNCFFDTELIRNIAKFIKPSLFICLVRRFLRILRGTSLKLLCLVDYLITT
jgi:hypothetical protein